MHSADDWEEEDKGWDDKYDNTRESIAQGTANHQRKFGMLEDGYNLRWQAMVNLGRRMTAKNLYRGMVSLTLDYRDGIKVHLYWSNIAHSLLHKLPTCNIQTVC